MTPELLAQDAAAKAERLAIEKARQLLDRSQDDIGEWFIRQLATLDEREAANVAKCPHLKVTTSAHRMLGTEFVATCCEACGLWIPEAAAKEGGR